MQGINEEIQQDVLDKSANNSAKKNPKFAKEDEVNDDDYQE